MYIKIFITSVLSLIVGSASAEYRLSVPLDIKSIIFSNKTVEPPKEYVGEWIIMDTVKTRGETSRKCLEWSVPLEAFVNLRDDERRRSCEDKTPIINQFIEQNNATLEKRNSGAPFVKNDVVLTWEYEDITFDCNLDSNLYYFPVNELYQVYVNGERIDNFNSMVNYHGERYIPSETVIGYDVDYNPMFGLCKMIVTPRI
jgi:hypothetical protein